MLVVVSTTEKRDQARTWKQSVGAIMGALGTPPSSGTQNYDRDTSSQYKQTKSEMWTFWSLPTEDSIFYHLK